ncbi:hypothetical protein BJ508DRAFT_309478 [Ascobolus immersus RN42]|uniref:Uncharacterized protein n=1 Tax=Ascobolus immersus RN42 TaxID=1160509 RepID=A0A3N4I070_ASCIM|nr:hypothetical protein BJ508DRAFT_309478 [Ascobolus immersus RN42]
MESGHRRYLMTRHPHFRALEYSCTSQYDRIQKFSTMSSLSSLSTSTLPSSYSIPAIYPAATLQTEELSTQTTQPLYLYITPSPDLSARPSYAVPSRFTLPPHPHGSVIEAITASDDFKVRRDRQPPLKDYRNWFKVYWDIIANPLATYSLSPGRSTLVVCDEGVWEINEDIDYCRFRGKEDHLEDGPWIYYDHYLSRNEDEEEEEEDIYFG